MRFDRSRRIHFRRKLSFQYLEGSAVCKAEKHFHLRGLDGSTKGDP
jgi:hypothetical protein